MKKLLATSILCLSSVSVNAGTCAALDYAEMQDMSVAELTQEYCKARDNYVTLFEEVIRYIGEPRTVALRSSMAECDGQSNRIWRVLTKKGVDDAARLGNKVCLVK